MLWLHITENLAKNLNCIFKHFVNIGLSQKHIICVNNKVNTKNLWVWKYVVCQHRVQGVFQILRKLDKEDKRSDEHENKYLEQRLDTGLETWPFSRVSVEKVNWKGGWEKRPRYAKLQELNWQSISYGVTSHQERGKTVSDSVMVCDCILTSCFGGYFKLKES